ncbi:Histidinol dehydrogenase, monofunctional [Moorella glycerini]|uniref:Histidinol dehydrogenase n=1 Tax=Neomoorella stamsii TaxID=1266720 RepID=A0A9X7J091_9FIRM|nr:MULTISPECIES: histidinol dehydrogenase [Moorella]PRR68958.1 Histidinol dehydrogenase [Moorella stamsii]CEP67579.1 Histidinol dehydrogenase, monofunctional [Moorella glycerini]
MLPVLEGEEVRRRWAGRLLAQIDVAARVRDIITAVRAEGQAAVERYTRELDGVDLKKAGFRVTAGEIEAAYEAVTPELREAIQKARDNIAAYHRRELRGSWMEADAGGTILGQICRPLKRVGLYVPGGTAAYPSSVLMTAVPARVAGVEEIALATPPRRDGTLPPLLLVAAAEAGVKEIYKMGGAQAVAALAYGTEAVAPVDKIAGPGNIYVTLAKKEVYGAVDIDMLAGPSEIVVIADAYARPDWVAADLLSQAEHDALAGAVLITPEPGLARAVVEEVARQLETLPRREIAARSLAKYGACVVVPHLEAALDLANALAPEHLELYVSDPWSWLGRVENAGAIFLGPYSSEPLGDYWAGPSHVLPTGGTARFYSPLSVATFMKKSSLIAAGPAYLKAAGSLIQALARAEGLEGHARAIELRLEEGDSR